MAEHFDTSAHKETYSAFLKLTQYTLLAVIIVLVGLAFALIGGMKFFGLAGMVFGLIVCTGYFALKQ